MLQRLTNHVLPSTTHRVVNPTGERASRPRYSMPFFLHFNSDFPIETLSSCVTPGRPNRYPAADPRRRLPAAASARDQAALLTRLAKLYFYYSTMNAGKSTALLQSSHNYHERGMRTLVYTAELDQRGAGKVHSRIGLTSDALHFGPRSHLFREIESEHGRQPVSCVLLDEAQFLKREQVDDLAMVVDDLSIPVLATACAPISAASCSRAARDCSRLRTNSPS
jgi:hypothetical protein